MHSISRSFKFLVLLAFLISCSAPADKSKEIASTDSLPKTEATKDSSWKTYKGTLPCADCPGIEMELKLKDEFTIESYQFELTETYKEAENGKDQSYFSKGMYNFWRGNSKDPDATIIVLNDDSAESAKRFFLRVSDNELKVVNNKGDEADSKLNFSLLRVKE